MFATILIVVMILLQTGALSLGLMVGRGFITTTRGGRAAQIGHFANHSTLSQRHLKI